MSYYSTKELKKLNFKKIGKNVLLSKKAFFYFPKNIEIGDNTRIDDLCILSGKIIIGKFVHITPMCLLAGGNPGIVISDFSTLSYGVKIFSQSDDYTGGAMANSTVASEYKRIKYAPVYVDKFSIIGANSVVMPGCTLSEGTSIGTMSLVNKNTSKWTVYFGIPAKKIKKKKKNFFEYY